MSERGEYHPPEEIVPENRDITPVSTAHSSSKFTRRHFLELAGVAAGAMIGAKIETRKAGDEDGRELAQDSKQAEPIKVSPPEPPDNLPVEPEPVQHKKQAPPAEKDTHYGVNLRKKNKKDKNKSRGKKREHKNKRNKKRNKEFFENIKMAWSDILREELERICSATKSSCDKGVIDKIFAREDEQIINQRLGGADLKSRMARRYFSLVEKNPKLYMESFERATASSGVPPQILFSVFAIEGAGRQSNKNRFLFEENTARAYGLAVDKERGIDERANLDKSACACARYLRDLYGAFGNQWGLALGAYNGGSGRMRGMLKRYFSVEPSKSRTMLGFQFEEDKLAQLGINAASLYLKESKCLMARKIDRKSRFDLRSIWYPFAADALGRLGWKNIMESAAKKKVARAFPNLKK